MSNRKIEIKRNKKPRSDQDFFESFDQEIPNEIKDVKSYTRATFIVQKSQLRDFRDYVHTRKKENYRYSQKQAIKEALELLFNTVDKIEKRDDDQ